MPARDLPAPPPGNTGPGDQTLPAGLRLDAGEIARRDPAAALASAMKDGAGKGRTAPAHHGAGDPRQAARERSGRARAGRGAPGGGRSYAFRRS
ncbi:hypothetical protein [Actinoplanes sp. RD1]|uniref:hypothetical protein n=1 Tax=Actinoplanes sp. RD1 TaxID=3064538 RepID=UPI0027404F1A|nr:hypothetical protein [Actinoplanes sp. RD1]